MKEVVSGDWWLVTEEEVANNLLSFLFFTTCFNVNVKLNQLPIRHLC